MNSFGGILNQVTVKAVELDPSPAAWLTCCAIQFAPFAIILAGSVSAAKPEAHADLVESGCEYSPSPQVALHTYPCPAAQNLPDGSCSVVDEMRRMLA